MKQFKARASAAGILLTRDGVNSKTVQTYLQDWVKEQIYGYQKRIDNKYLSKGIDLEDEAIDFTVKALDLPFIMKNEKQFEDDFFTGTPDIILENEIIDIKSSWSCWTFPLFDTMFQASGKPYADFRNYYIQGQIYMHLTGRKLHSVVYCLLNTPEELISWEELHDYSQIDEKYRFRRIKFEYNPEVIEELQGLVLEAREYIENLTI